MPFFDVKERASEFLRANGYPCDPMSYISSHPVGAGATSTLSIKPFGSRGWFLAFGLAGAPQSSSSLRLSLVTLSVDARPITESPIVSPLLIHGNANGGVFNASGIDMSQWPAPIIMPPASSLNVSEVCVDQADNMASVRRSLNGIHTSGEGAKALARDFGELRCFGVTVRPVSTVANGIASNGWTFLGDARLVEWAVVNQDAAPAALDYVRGKVGENDILIGNRLGTNTAGVGLPIRLGVPTSYLGRRVEAGQTLTVEERISATTRNDFWGGLMVAPVEKGV